MRWRSRKARGAARGFGDFDVPEAVAILREAAPLSVLPEFPDRQVEDVVQTVGGTLPAELAAFPDTGATGGVNAQRL